MIPVAGFLNALEAHMLRTRLEADGVPAFIQNEHLIYAKWSLALALGGVRVCVVEEDAERASAVVRACLAGEYRAQLMAEFGDLDDPSCPACGSTRFESRSSYLDIALVAAAVFGGFIFPARAYVHRCQTCGHRWDGD